MNTTNSPSAAAAHKISALRLAEVFRQINFAPRYKYGPHNHHRLEINYVKRGSCTIHLPDHTSFGFKKDDLMVIPPIWLTLLKRDRETPDSFSSSSCPSSSLMS